MLTDSNPIQRLWECDKLLIPGCNNLQYNVWIGLSRQSMYVMCIFHLDSWITFNFPLWDNSPHAQPHGQPSATSESTSEATCHDSNCDAVDGTFVTGCHRYTDFWQFISGDCGKDVFSRSTYDTFLANLKSILSKCTGKRWAPKMQNDCIASERNDMYHTYVSYIWIILVLLSLADLTRAFSPGHLALPNSGARRAEFERQVLRFSVWTYGWWYGAKKKLGKTVKMRSRI